MQAEYQTHLKEQYFLDQIKKDKEEAQASLDGANERLEGLKRVKEAQEREAAESMQSMEVAHMRAAEELENLYERKLAAESARFEALRQEKEDMQCQFEVCADSAFLAETAMPTEHVAPYVSQERLFGLHKQSKSDEERLRTELEEKRRDAETRASEVRQKASSMRARYEEMLKQAARARAPRARPRLSSEYHVRATRDRGRRKSGTTTRSLPCSERRNSAPSCRRERSRRR